MKYVASIALAILLQKLDDVLSILANMLFVSIISVDENHQVGSVAIHLRSLIVAGWSSHTTDIVSVNRQTFDVDYASADALMVRLPCPHLGSECLPETSSASKPPIL